MGVDGGMEPQEQGGVALCSSASAMPEALPGTMVEEGGGVRAEGGPPAPGRVVRSQALGDHKQTDAQEGTSCGLVGFLA